MKILILGGAGMIGQAIAKKHIEAGDEVDIFDTFINLYTNPLPQYGNLVCNIAVKNYDLISNQAALVGVGESMYSPYKYLSNNVGVTGHLIQAIIDAKKQIPVIHAGSMGPYGEGPRKCYVCNTEFYVPYMRTTIDIPCPHCGECNNDAVPIHESAEMHPQSMYAITKYAQEEALRVFAQAYQNPVISLRYFSVYSTDQSPVNPKTGVLSIIGNQILNRGEIIINEDGEQTRDLIHVADVANAHFLASRLLHTYDFIPINIGTGWSYSMIHLAKHMRAIMSPSTDIITNGEVRKGDIKDSCASTYRAEEILKFTAQINVLDSATEYCKFLTAHEEEFRSDSWAKEQARVKERGLQ